MNRPGDQTHLADLAAAERLLTLFSAASLIGLAICDDQLRYRSINGALATMNGITPAAHVGNTVRDILGDAASKPEPALRRVLASGQSACFELAAMLPTRNELGYWIENYFPVKGSQGRVTQVATVTVEVTMQRKLEKSFRKLTGELLWAGSQQNRWLARDLHDSINEYHAALAASLARLTTSIVALTGHRREPEISDQLLAQAAKFLDRRVANMRATLSKVARHFCE